MKHLLLILFLFCLYDFVLSDCMIIVTGYNYDSTINMCVAKEYQCKLPSNVYLSCGDCNTDSGLPNNNICG